MSENNHIRLSDKILEALEVSIQQNDLEIAILLDHALDKSMTRNTGGGGKDVTSEQAQTLAAQMLQNATLLSTSVQRFMLMTDLKPGQFDMQSAESHGSSGDVSACTTAACNVLDPAGGGATIAQMPEKARDPAATNCAASPREYKPMLLLLSVDQLGTTAPELVILYCGVRNEVCRAINTGLGLAPEVMNTIGGVGAGNYAIYGGNAYPLPVTTPGRIGIDTRLKGAYSFCSYQPDMADNNGNIFIHVLAVN